MRNKTYIAPAVECVEIEIEGIICASGVVTPATNGGSTSNMTSGGSI